MLHTDRKTQSKAKLGKKTTKNKEQKCVRRNFISNSFIYIRKRYKCVCFVWKTVANKIFCNILHEQKNIMCVGSCKRVEKITNNNKTPVVYFFFYDTYTHNYTHTHTRYYFPFLPFRIFITFNYMSIFFHALACECIAYIEIRTVFSFVLLLLSHMYRSKRNTVI